MVNIYIFIFLPPKPLVAVQTYDHRESNLMNESNLAIIFSPVLGASSDIITHFITDYDQVFLPSERPKLPPEWPNMNFSKVQTVPLGAASTKQERDHSVPPKTNHVPAPQHSVPPKTNHVPPPSSSSATPTKPEHNHSVPPKTNHVPLPGAKPSTSYGLKTSLSQPISPQSKGVHEVQRKTVLKLPPPPVPQQQKQQQQQQSQRPPSPFSPLPPKPSATKKQQKALPQPQPQQKKALPTLPQQAVQSKALPQPQPQPQPPRKPLPGKSNL